MPLDSLLLAAADAAPLEMRLRIPLSVMNFLEFAIWGAWWTVLGLYLETLAFTRKQIGRVYATMAIGAIITPLFVGWLVDSVFSGQYVLGISHLIGAVLLFALAQIRREKLFYWVTLLYAFVFTPTLGLSNAVVFSHLPDATRDFPWIRVLGTIGWIAAGLSLKLLLKPGQPVTNRPLLLAGWLSLVLGVFSFFLPSTPPGDPHAVDRMKVAFSDPSWQNIDAAIPTIRALKLFDDPSFAVFFVATFVAAAAFAFYFAYASLYLERRIHVRPDNVGPLMTVGQWVEIVGMAALPTLIPLVGMKTVLAVGMAAVALRYAIFSVGQPYWLVVLAIALHGICFDFFLAAGMIFVEKFTDPAIRGSAQSLFGVLTYGLGTYLGTEASAWINQRLTHDEPNGAGQVQRVTDWKKFWLVPTAIAAITTVIFLGFFHEPQGRIDQRASNVLEEQVPQEGK